VHFMALIVTPKQLDCIYAFDACDFTLAIHILNLDRNMRTHEFRKSCPIGCF
jgi:hypothetical protein